MVSCRFLLYRSSALILQNTKSTFYKTKMHEKGKIGR
uniref:Uncharacterized protein n=1 Tax=Arundo donax TaxID=35708 RepID=A0A0A9AVW3_ARUDO